MTAFAFDSRRHLQCSKPNETIQQIHLIEMNRRDAISGVIFDWQAKITWNWRRTEFTIHLWSRDKKNIYEKNL